MPGIGGADDGHGRLQKIGNRRALTHELRIDADAEVLSQASCRWFVPERGSRCFRRFRAERCCAARPGEMLSSLQHFADFPANRLDVTEVELAAAQARSSNAEKGNLGLHHGRTWSPWWHAAAPRREPSTSSFMPGSTIGLRPASSCSTLDGLSVDADDRVPLGGETGGRDRSNVAQPKNADSLAHELRSRYCTSPRCSICAHSVVLERAKQEEHTVIILDAGVRPGLALCLMMVTAVS